MYIILYILQSSASHGKKFIVKTEDNNEEHYFHVLQVPLLNMEFESILKGAKI